MFATEEFRIKILEEVSFSMTNSICQDVEREDDVFQQTKLLFFQLIASESESVDPCKLKKSLPQQFSLSNTEQDAFEFLQVFLDCLEKQLDPVCKNTF